MKLLVFAATPPPVHGQNVMVAQTLSALKQDPRFAITHINPGLSRTHEDVGRWQLGKVGRLVIACLRALAARIRCGPMAFYYVPAPAKRSALYRDWLVMLCCRPFFSPVILHWHAVGLGEWIEQSASAIERTITRSLLGRVNLSIVLEKTLQSDAERLKPRRVEIVRNGIPDPCPDWRPTQRVPGPLRCLFLGLCTTNKGLFDLLEAVALANGSSDQPRVTLTVAGSFASEAERRLFQTRADALRGAVRYLGPVHGKEKSQVFSEADVFCFPTHYPHEGQPLTVIEALAYDLPIVASRWRAIPDMLPLDGVWLFEPNSVDQLAHSLNAAYQRRWTEGARRSHYLSHFSRDLHIENFTAALLSAESLPR